MEGEQKRVTHQEIQGNAAHSRAAGVAMLQLCIQPLQLSPLVLCHRRLQACWQVDGRAQAFMVAVVVRIDLHQLPTQASSRGVRSTKRIFALGMLASSFSSSRRKEINELALPSRLVD